MHAIAKPPGEGKACADNCNCCWLLCLVLQESFYHKEWGSDLILCYYVVVFYFAMTGNGHVNQ